MKSIYFSISNVNTKENKRISFNLIFKLVNVKILREK